MSEELKWWEIERAVWERGPREKAQRAVLAQLARHADAAGATFVGQPKIAERSGFALATVKRAIAALEFAGWLRVEERAVLVETARGFERKGNLYRLDLVKLGLAMAKKKTGDGGCGPAGKCSDEGVGPAAKTSVEGCGPAREGRVGWSDKPVQTESARSHLDGGEVSLEARRGVIRGAPLINIFEPEKLKQEEPPYAPPCGGGSVETFEKQRQQQQQRQKLPDQGGGSANLVVFPARQRQPRQARDGSSVREQLDGEDAALWDEATRVMRACGVSPESSGRKVRRAVLEALRLECERSGRPIANAGVMMQERWRQYEQLGTLRYAPLGFTRFIAEGEWLRPNGWRLDRDEVKRREMSAEARLGRWSGTPGSR